MNKHILFIHIPKTAGTSFRLSAKNYFGDENVFFDYNISSSETSKVIIDHIYKGKDLYALNLDLFKHKQIFLSGHFNATKYAALFDTLNTITFVRNPIDQVISHYKHFITYSNYKEDIKTFIKENRFKNIQSKMLTSRALELYGFIGLTERYNESIELINKNYKLNLEPLTLNVAINEKEIGSDIIDLIAKENELDIRLYEKAKRIFDTQLKCHEKNKPYTYGFIQELNANKIRGIAFQKENKHPIEIEIYNNNELITVTHATNYRQGILMYSSTRKAFVGFDYNFEKPISDLSTIKVIVKNTKQELY